LAVSVMSWPAPRTVLSQAATRGGTRLDRLDRLDRPAAWTRATLGAIAVQPGRRAAEVAALVGRDIAAFKPDVRKLKALGLTESLEVGYRLTPRGHAVVAALTAEEAPGLSTRGPASASGRDGQQNPVGVGAGDPGAGPASG
jgi:zona occludens toxin (predicted ATPase)